MNDAIQLYAGHRERLLERLRAEGMAAVVFTNSPQTRNHDSEFRFRPDSDFWWLTGFREPSSVLVLLPGREAGESILFLRPRVKSEETWTGLRLGVERACEELGVDEARPIAELWDALPDLIQNYESVLYQTGKDAERDRHMFEVGAKVRARARSGVVGATEWVDPLNILHELRLFKDAGELEIMRRAAVATHDAHVSAMAHAEPGMNEAEIDATVVHRFMRAGGKEAYNNIIAGGANACILHYNENDQPLGDGDLLLIDAGCELDCYASDVTRTFPVNGTFTPEQRAIYETVLEAEKRAIEHVKPGVGYMSMHEVAVRAVCEGLVAHGLLEGSVDEVIESGAYTRFFMHKTGHWLGLDVHDCGRYVTDGEPRAIEPGMVFTIEPGLYIAPDDDTVEARWRGIGVRIEDDILVTETGYENLTASIPKEVDDVEAACRGEVASSGRPTAAAR